MDGFTVRPLHLHIPFELQMLQQLLTRCHLKLEGDIDYAVGLFDREGELAACGCAAGKLLKCFAVNPELRGENALGLLLGALVRDRFDRGLDDLFVITRTKNAPLFSQSGFWPVAQTSVVALLENRPDGPAHYLRSIQATSGDQNAGAIVMNCNPFTLGHRNLIEYAAKQCDFLHIFVVEENRSMFPFADRFRLVQDGTADISNVYVHPSGPYIISNLTFPTYFLKQDEDAAAIQAELDITLFGRHIAPALHITRRFAGEEPLDPITAKYNMAMKTLLPQFGIRFSEIPRATVSGQIISASAVRHILQEQGFCKQLLQFVPPVTARYLREEFQGWNRN